MKYQDLIDSEYSDKVGSVNIAGHNVQLCDHIQVVNGRYHVSALFTDEKETAALNEMGAPTKKMYNGTKIVYLNEGMLLKAKPIYQDGMTMDLIKRLMAAMATHNAQRVAVA